MNLIALTLCLIAMFILGYTVVGYLLFFKDCCKIGNQVVKSIEIEFYGDDIFITKVNTLCDKCGKKTTTKMREKIEMDGSDKLDNVLIHKERYTH